MLKFWLVLLLLLNAVLLAWQWDAFARWGHGPQQHREPERMQQQVRPEALKFEVMPPAPARPPPAADASATDAASPAAALTAPTPSASQAVTR